MQSQFSSNDCSYKTHHSLDLSRDIESINLSSGVSPHFASSSVVISDNHNMSSFPVTEDFSQTGGITQGIPPTHSNIPLAHSNNMMKNPFNNMNKNSYSTPPPPAHSSSIVKGFINKGSSFNNCSPPPAAPSNNNNNLNNIFPSSSHTHSSPSSSSSHIPSTGFFLPRPPPSALSFSFSTSQDQSTPALRSSCSVANSINNNNYYNCSSNNNMSSSIINSSNSNSNCSSHIPRKRQRKTGLATVVESNKLEAADMMNENTTVGKYKIVKILSSFLYHQVLG